ncbi:MAG: nuclear transport factor 2 family protein [Gammaproteobacteria bacterium]|jgi:hypothetical protein
MTNPQWLQQLFQSIDGQNVPAFLELLADDVYFRFGNNAPAQGINDTANLVTGFFESIKGLQHEIRGSWTLDDTTCCHGFVTYTRHDNSTLNVPFANIFKRNGQGITEYLIFADISQLYTS